MNNNQKTFICDCDDEVLVVTQDDPFGFNFAMFNRYYNVFTWRDRLRFIWRIIKFGKPYTDQLCLSYDKCKDLAKFLTTKKGTKK